MTYPCPRSLDESRNALWIKHSYESKLCKIIAQYNKAWKRKMRKTVFFKYSKLQKRHNSNKSWDKLTTLKLDLKYSKTKSYAKLQLNISKHVGENCGILCISSILNSKRGITPTKIDTNWQHSTLICSTVKQSHMQNYSSIWQSM